MRKLVVLDINGVIAQNTRELGLMITPYGRRVVMSLSKKYDVGLYSSTTRPKVGNFVANSGLSDKFKFVFARENTFKDPIYGGWKTIKPLSTVFNRYPEYDYTNTIIIDDTPEKVRYNPEENVIIAKSDMNLMIEIDLKFNALKRYWAIKRLEECNSCKWP